MCGMMWVEIGVKDELGGLGGFAIGKALVVYFSFNCIHDGVWASYNKVKFLSINLHCNLHGNRPSSKLVRDVVNFTGDYQSRRKAWPT